MNNRGEVSGVWPVGLVVNDLEAVLARAIAHSIACIVKLGIGSDACERLWFRIMSYRHRERTVEKLYFSCGTPVGVAEK